MNYLLIETATERGMFAYFSGEKEVFSYHLPFGLQEAQKLLAELQNKLQLHGLTMQSINAIAVGVGPGSYTGIRMAATEGKILSYALSIPLVGVCTLETFVPNTEGPFAVVLDAKIAGVYMQTGIKLEKEIVYTSSPMVAPIEQAMENLKNIQTVISPNTTVLKEKLKGHWQWQESPPCPQQMLHIAKEKLKNPPTNLELLYLR